MSDQSISAAIFTDHPPMLRTPHVWPSFVSQVMAYSLTASSISLLGQVLIRLS